MKKAMKMTVNKTMTLKKVNLKNMMKKWVRMNRNKIAISSLILILRHKKNPKVRSSYVKLLTHLTMIVTKMMMMIMKVVRLISWTLVMEVKMMRRKWRK